MSDETNKEDDRLLDELPDLGTIALKITDKPLRDIRLTQDDWRVISHIHPRNTVKQIAQNNNMDEFQIREIVSGMLKTGLVEMIPPERSDDIEVSSPQQSTGSKKQGKKKKNGGRTGGNSGSGGLPDLVSIRRQQPGRRPPSST